MKRAIELHNAGLARVIPVIIRECSWHASQIGKFQALPVDGKAVTTWGYDQFLRDAAWKNVADGVERVLLEIRGQDASYEMPPTLPCTPAI